jgi:hypothetical protein
VNHTMSQLWIDNVLRNAYRIVELVLRFSTREDRTRARI